MKFIFLIIFNSLLLSQLPITLERDDSTEPFIFFAENSNEYLLSINAKTNTDWSVTDAESSTITVVVDGEITNYNQDLVLYAGDTLHVYNCSLGFLDSGNHSIQFIFDYNKSSEGSEWVYIESIEIINIDSLNVDPDVFAHSPILYGRDLLSWNESTHTDIPLLMWHEIAYEGLNKTITYSVIFSNEDSRVGVGLAELMYSYGRTTDIEWLYKVTLDSDGEIINEMYQGPSHVPTVFSGSKNGLHPILKNATLNCNFSDSGFSQYKFFLSPTLTIDINDNREILMDENPWTYKIMAQELINEQRYESIANPETVEISDVRNYIYIEYDGLIEGTNPEFELSISMIGDCKKYTHHHNYNGFNKYFYGGRHRTSIELPNGFNPDYINQIGFLVNGDNFEITITDISRLFYLDENFNPINININFSTILLSDTSNSYWLTINHNITNIDCLGIPGGFSQCDDCDICDGGNIDMDDCGICFGNNIDIDCNGLCFGTSYFDECGICDASPENDNSLCSGCTDVNAENYDLNAIFDDGSCVYSNNIFYVPEDYITIQDAIDFSNNGDTIVVSPGIYHENINFLSKSIFVRSTYMDDTELNQFVISGVDSVSVVTIENIADGGSALEGFTITQGYGKGVSFDDFISLASDEILFDSLITNTIRGGGISVINSSPNLKDLHIYNNVSRNVGGGIALVNSNSVIESVIVANNSIPDGDALGGGGIAINGGNPHLIDIIISSNTVGSNMYYLNGGGGIFCGFSFGQNNIEVNIENSIIMNNSANIGAGLGVLSGSINILRSLFIQNTGNFGSSISMGEPLGLVVGDINLNMINSTVSSNNGNMSIAMTNSANFQAVNSIFWNNSDIEFSPLPNNNELNIDISYSIVSEQFSGQSNFYTDPLFTDISNNDYSLRELSPCIDAGTADIDNDGVDDIENYFGLAPDLGWYEFEVEDQIIPGDVNFDGLIDIIDVVIGINIILGNIEASNTELEILDVNQDSNINVIDIVEIINQILIF